MAVGSRQAVECWRTFRLAAWLGWQMESNWADPFLFSIYSIVKPVSHSLILVVMYLVVRGQAAGAGLFAQMFVGNAFFLYVGQILFGLTWVIIEDREFYQMFKYMYVSTPNMYWYLLGRSFAKMAIATVSVVIVLAFGKMFLRLPIHASTVDLTMVCLSMLFGMVSCVGMGIGLAGVMLIIARHGGHASEAVAGALFLLSGAVFPIDILPRFALYLAKALPTTYWLEGVRRGLLGSGMSQAMAAFSDRELMIVLAVLSLLSVILGTLTFITCEKTAKSRGLIDMHTHH
ncbi:MAG: ABC transporter permease [Bacillota bacterium]